jgi:hypothetical protein
VDLVKWIKSISTCPDRGQFPQLEGSGPRHSAYKKARETKFTADEAKPKNKGPDPLGCHSGGMHNYRSRSRFVPLRRRRLQFAYNCKPHGMRLLSPM